MRVRRDVGHAIALPDTELLQRRRPAIAAIEELPDRYSAGRRPRLLPARDRQRARRANSNGVKGSNMGDGSDGFRRGQTSVHTVVRGSHSGSHGAGGHAGARTGRSYRSATGTRGPRRRDRLHPVRRTRSRHRRIDSGTMSADAAIVARRGSRSSLGARRACDVHALRATSDGSNHRRPMERSPHRTTMIT